MDRLLFRLFLRATAFPQRGFQPQGGRGHYLPVCCSERLLSVHTGAQGREFMIDERLIDPRKPVSRDLNGSEVTQMRKSQARPGPVHGMFDQPSANRIAKYVAQDRQEMRVLLNRKTFEAALPHMPVAVVVPMVAANVARHPPLHEWTEGGGGGRLHHQVKMIRHQAEAQDLDGVGGFRRGEQVEERGIVAVLVEDRGAAVPTIQYMVGVSGHLSARNPRHRSARYAKLGSGGKKK